MYIFANLEFLADAYPESNQAADEAVQRYRSSRPEGSASVTTFLNFNEHVVAISARLAPVFDLGRWIMTAGRAISRELWPEFPLEVTPTVLCNRLASTPSRIRRHGGACG